MKVIGVTGGAGSGKSEVLHLLENEFGAHVIMADDVARKLSEKGGASYDAVVGYFGTDILDSDGKIDRKKLAAIVFGHSELLEKLNSFTHPMVKSVIQKEIADVRRAGQCSFIALEAALLIEAGYEDICDEFWYVYTDEAIRRRRMKESRGYSDEKIDSIIKNQLSEEQFKKACQRIVVNNTTLSDVHSQLEEMVAAVTVPD